MKIGIIGSNDRAAAIGRLLRSGGHMLTLADPNAGERARTTAAAVGAWIENPYKQAMCCDIVVFALPQVDLDRAVRAMGPGPDAVIVDAIEPERGNGSLSGAEMLARKLDSHRVVRALVNLPQSGANVPICGDDPDSKVLLDRALRACGCVTTDRGPLRHARELQSPPLAA